MTDEKTDLKKETDKSSSDTGQSGSSSELNYEEFDDETFIVPKSELKKLFDDKENYKKGLLAYKDKDKADKVEKKEAPAKETTEKVEGDFVTKDEFRKALEKDAIKKVAEGHPEIVDSWDKIVEFYSPRSGRDSVDAIASDLEDAFFIWERKTGGKKETEDKKAKADLASDSSGVEKGSGSKGTEKERKRVLPKRTPVTEWYKDPNKKDE